MKKIFLHWGIVGFITGLIGFLSTHNPAAFVGGYVGFGAGLIINIVDPHPNRMFTMFWPYGASLVFVFLFLK